MRKTRETALSSIQEYTLNRQNTIRRRHSNSEYNLENDTVTEATPLTADVDAEPEPEVVWLKRDDFREPPKPFSNTFEMENNSNHTDNKQTPASRREPRHPRHESRTRPQRLKPNTSVSKPCHFKANITPKEGDTKSETYYRKLIVAEWQRVAAVVDRVLFWVYFIGTIVSYLVILIIIPRENYALWDAKIQQTPYVRSDSRYTM